MSNITKCDICNSEIKYTDVGFISCKMQVMTTDESSELAKYVPHTRNYDICETCYKKHIHGIFYPLDHDYLML